MLLLKKEIMSEIKIKNKETCIISLGCDCFPRTFTTVAGLKPRKEEGELSMPFDLSWSTNDALIHFINTDFKNFFDNIVFDKEKKYYFNKKYTMGFNHDMDCEDSKEGFEKLVQRYKARIQNFREALNSDKFLLFVYNAPPKSEKGCNKLYKVLKNKRKNKDFRLVILDMDMEIKKALLDKNILLCAVKHPFNNRSEWWYPNNLEKRMEYCIDCGKVFKSIIANII